MDLLQIAFTLIIGLMAWWCKTIWADKNSLEKDFTKFQLDISKNYIQKSEFIDEMKTLNKGIAKLANLELLLVREYVSKHELKEILSDILKRVDKLDGN